MKNRMKKAVAALLLMTILLSDFPMSALHAADAISQSSGVSGENSVSENQNESLLNYVYVEKAYVETPETQNIVVSWGDGTETVRNMRITVEKEDGSTEEWSCDKNAKELYLFSKEYTDKNEESTYKVLNIKFEENGTEKQIELASADAVTEFGVNKAYEGMEKLQPLDPEQGVDARALEASVFTIDENGELVNANNLLRTGGEPIARDGNIVVALDPGHDNKHGGASYSGLVEQELTLKIANYAKAELETYSAVQVYMTRTSNECPYPKTAGAADCIKERAYAAAKAGAKIFVSFHLNSADFAPSANGAEIIIPNENWKPQTAKEGKELAEKIMAELVAVGLNPRSTPIYSKDSTLAIEKYPDGSKSDYFSVQIYNKENGIPGIIIEHAFMTNSNDVNKFLNNEAGLKKLGTADATGIAKYLNLDKGYWKGDSYYVNGQKITNQGYKIGTYWYYFDENGIAKKNWWREKGADRFYYDENGHLLSNVGYKVDGYWYYFGASGAMQKNWWRDKGADRFYYDEAGHLLSNVGYKVDGYWYYFGASGAMQKNWWRDKEADRFYYDENGHLLSNVGYKVDGYWYYFGASGAMQKNWWRDKGADRFYYDENGHLLSNVGYKVDGYWYYFGASGAMQKNWWRDKGADRFYYDENGHLLSNVGYKVDGYWYYFGASGAMQKNWWRDKEADRFYYDENGHLLSNVGYKVDGYWYYFGASGAMQKNWWRDKGADRFYYDEEGHLLSNVGYKVDGYWYYFGASGAMQKNWWRDKEGKKYYYDENGHLVVDKILTIDGKTYYFDKSGATSESAGTGYPIAGESSVTVEQLMKYYNENTAIAYPKEALGKGGASTLKEFCQIFHEECEIEGIRVEVAFTQAMVETGFLKFGKDVKIEQYNFAGLGATGGGVAGASFKDVRTGVRAQVQHLKCYANKEELKQELVDPRWSNSLRGKAPYVEWLSIENNPNGTGWAQDAAYGKKLFQAISKIIGLQNN